MSRAQRLVVVVGLVVTAGLALHPPWDHYDYYQGDRDQPPHLYQTGEGHFAFVWNPRHSSDHFTHRLAWSRFALLLAAWWLIVGVVLLVLRRHQVAS